MKKVQSVLFALALAISLSSTVLAGNVHTTAPVNVNSNGIIVGDVKSDGILIAEVFTWGDVTGAIVSSFGILIGC